MARKHASVAALLCMACAPVCAEPTAQGGVLKLNPDAAPTAYQGAARIMRAPGGGFAAVWTEWDSSIRDLRQLTRAYSAAALPRGGTVQVSQRGGLAGNTYAAGDRDGNFVVAWNYRSGEPPAYVSEGVYARRFDADARPLGDEFEVAPPPVSTTASMAAAMAPNGRFAVAWFGKSQGPEIDGLYVRLFEADGTPRTDPLRLVDLHSHYGRPQVLMREDGSILLGYSCSDVDGTGCGGGGNEPFIAYVRGFDADGAPTFGPVKLGVEVEISALNPLPEDGFQVIWAKASPGAPYSSWNVFGRRFSAGGTPAAPEFQVNVEYASHTVASGVDAAGATTVVWLDDEFRNLFARSFDRWVQPDGGEFTVGDARIAESAAEVSFDGDGDFLLVWVCPEGDLSTLCARFYGEPAEGPPPVKTESLGIANNEIAGAFAAPTLLLLAIGGALRRRRS